MIRVLIADDQLLIVGALAALLDTEPDISVVATFTSADGVVSYVQHERVDVALLDIEMPGQSGLDLAEQLMRLDAPCRVIMVTTFGRPGYLHRALEAGVSGFVVKETPPEQLGEAIRKVAAGLRVVDPELASAARGNQANPLTAREKELCRLAVTGAEVRSIARTMHLSEGTVRNHISSVLAKTNTTNRYAAARAAERLGWL